MSTKSRRWKRKREEEWKGAQKNRTERAPCTLATKTRAIVRLKKSNFCKENKHEKEALGKGEEKW